MPTVQNLMWQDQDPDDSTSTLLLHDGDARSGSDHAQDPRRLVQRAVPPGDARDNGTAERNIEPGGGSGIHLAAYGPGTCWMCTEKRWQLGLLGFAMEAVCYADRTNITLAVIEMQREMGWDDQAVGLIMSSFFAGYLCTQVLGGWAASRFGVKLVLSCAVTAWSLFTLVTPLAARTSVPSLLVVRVLMGLGEGVALPAMHHATGIWVPEAERSRFVTLCTSGQFAGTVAAMACGPMVASDWPGIFYLFGIVGLVWVAVWQWLAASRPEGHRAISPRELEYIRQSVKRVAPTDAPPPWRRFASNAPFRAVVCAHFSHNWGWYLLLSWLPKYFSDVLHIETAGTGYLLILPFAFRSSLTPFAPPLLLYTVAFMASNLSGTVADGLLARDWSLRGVRIMMQTTAFAGPALALTMLCVTTTVSNSLAVILSCAALGLGAVSHSGFWSNVVDLSPRYSGVMLGISNTIATLPGILANLSTGYILQQTDGGWSAVFGLAIAVYIAGVVVFVTWSSGEVQFR